MNESDGFELSQGLTVLRPRSGKAYPIPCNEWKQLKEKIKKLTTEPWLYQTVGSLLIGVGISTLIPVLLGSYSKPDQDHARVVAWGVFWVASACGGLCLLFAGEKRQQHKGRANDVVAQMDLIEARFEPPSS
ncbi:MAG: hypothetical protein NDI58_00435 [Geothrix sp.]|nr:hypothetical protein [Geothrix sp.]